MKNFEIERQPQLPHRLWRRLSLYPHQRKLLAITAGPSFTFIYDSRLSSFLYFSPEVSTILGWSQETLMQSSVPSFLRKCHAEDRWAVINALRKTKEQMLEQYQEERLATSFLMDFRLKIAKGNYARMLMQASVQTEGANEDRKNQAMYWIGTFSDISYLKMEGEVSFSFVGSKKHIKLSDVSVNDKVLRLFSSREREVLKLLALGYSTQKIEEKLHISQHTVRTHRRNMHKKCKVENTAQLINLAIREGYI